MIKQKGPFYLLTELFTGKNPQVLKQENRREKGQRSQVQRVIKIQLTEMSYGSSGDTSTVHWET